MSDNGDLIVGVGAKTDTASFTQARDAIKGVGEAFEKTFAQVDRSKSLENAAKAFARIAVDEKDAANAAIQLVDELKELGATDKEISKTVTAFEKQIDAIKKADEAAERKAINDAERAAKEEARLIELAEAQERIANSAEGRAKQASDASGGLGDIGDNLAALGGVTGIGALGDIGGLFEATEAITRLKAGVQGLPESIQATAQALGLIKSAQDASTAAAGVAAAAETTQAAAAGGLATASGSASVGIGAMVASLGPIALVAGAAAVAIGALIAVFSALQAETAAANKALSDQFAAQDKVDDFVESGATLSQAYERQTELQEAITKATERRNEAEAIAAADFEARSKGIFGDFAARLGDVFNVKSTDEATNARIAETKKAAEEAEVELKELNKQIEAGAFKADEAAETTAKAAEKSTQATQKAAAVTTSSYKRDEQVLAQHLANEGSIKASAYNAQISMAQQAAASIANGFRPLNMSGASNAFTASTGASSPFSGTLGGLRPTTTTNTRTNTIGQLNINTSANPQDVVKVLHETGFIN